MMMYFLLSMIFMYMSLMFLNFSMLNLFFKNSLFIEWNLMYFFSTKINMLIYLDWISNLFIFTVLIISSMILLYSIEYMNKNILQFFYLLILFILSMIFMIISPNLISILLGWDGLGLISYCLVIFYQSKYSYSSGNLTIFSNRIGDITLIISISLMFMNSSWNFMNFNFNYFLLLLIMITAMTKSAQFPFSSWLPVAMAAPTPVSSLVHSSTLVTAGIYLMIRFNKLMYMYNNLMMMILYISMITTLMASMSAIFEYDFKKIIAYSTLSQLGLMMMILSMKMINLSMFHLIIHAMFKSMMFMCSGIFIHSLLNFQDIRYYGNMKKFMPLSCMMFFISNLSLCGMPFLSGFFSKDMILEFMLMSKLNYFIYLLLMFSIMLTLIYSFRLIYYLMFNKLNFLNYFNINDYKMMNFSMMILLLLSMISGMILNWIIFFSIEYIFLFYYNKLMILMILFLGLFIGMIMFKFNYNNKLYFLKLFLGTMWFSYKLIYLLLMMLKLGKIHYKFFDKGWSEMIFKNYFIYNLNNKLMKMNFKNFMLLIFLFNYLILLILLMI